MTVMAAEAGTAAFEGEAAQASTAAGNATRVSGGPRGEVRHDATRAQKRAARAQGASVQPRPRPDRPQRSSRQGGSKRKTPAVGFTGGGSPGSNYHGAILAEFVLAVLLVAATPFAAKNKTGVSPYAGKDMVQLLSLTLLYFLLAIVAGTGRTQARFAAWFGGLILLAVGLAEAANIAKDVNTFFGGSTDTSTADTSGSDVTAAAAITSTPSATGLERTVGQEPGTGLS